MTNFPGTLAKWGIVSMSAAWLFGVSVAAFGQEHGPCGEVNEVVQSCAAIHWVRVERGNPFVAERVARSGGQSFHKNDRVARDGAGRIYIEQHDLPWQFYSFSPHHDASTIWALGTASVFDCFSGKSIYLVPGSRTADIKQSSPNVPPFQQSNHPYSYALTLLLTLKTVASVSVEDLGNKQVEGLQARGIKITWLGTDKDGDWNRRPIRSSEVWRSDELGATLLMISSDLRKKIESRSALINIKRVEPDAALFEAPPDFKINLAPQVTVFPCTPSGTRADE